MNKAFFSVRWDHAAAENSSPTSSTLTSPAASQLRCHMDQKPCCISLFCMLFESGSQTHWGGGGSINWMKLLAWPLKFDIEQPSIVLTPCHHPVFVSDCELTNIIAYTIFINNVLVCMVHLFGNMENTIAIRVTVANNSFSASDFTSQTAHFAMSLASMQTVFAPLWSLRPERRVHRGLAGLESPHQETGCCASEISQVLTGWSQSPRSCGPWRTWRRDRRLSAGQYRLGILAFLSGRPATCPWGMM